VVLTHPVEPGFLPPANLHGSITARMKTTARRRVKVVGDPPRDPIGYASTSQFGDRLHQPHGVRVERLREQFVRGSHLDHVSGLHDVDAVSQLSHHPQGVGDEDDGGVPLLH